LYNFNPWAVSEGSAWFTDRATLITPLNGLGPEYKNCTASWVYGLIALDDSDTL